jgi:hypothetical protein
MDKLTPPVSSHPLLRASGIPSMRLAISPILSLSFPFRFRYLLHFPYPLVPGQPPFGPVPKGATVGVTPRVPRIGITIASALGVQGLSLCGRLALKGPRHLAPRAGAKQVHVYGFDPTPVFGAANLCSTLTVAFGWILCCPKSPSGVGRSARTARKSPLWHAGYKTCPRTWSLL